MSKCKGCGSEIMWITTKSGKNMPCNAKSVPFWQNPKGRHTVITSSGETFRCDLEGYHQHVTGFGYIVHWETCPAANRFKK